MVRVGAVSSSSWTSLRREQAPPMGRGQASPQGREASTTSSPATTSTLSFLTDVIIGAGSSTQPRPSAPSVSSSRPACKPGPAHPICTLSISPLISLPVCKNTSHSPSPFPCLSRRLLVSSWQTVARGVPALRTVVLATPWVPSHTCGQCGYVRCEGGAHALCFAAWHVRVRE